MSHYDKETEYEWAVLMKHNPVREMVTLEEASKLELRVAGHILREQRGPPRRVQWAAFFAGERQSVYGGFDVDRDTRKVLWDETVRDFDEAVNVFREELANDSVVSGLQRLRVPFRVIVTQVHKDDEIYMTRPSIHFHIAESIEVLESLPPEPNTVIVSSRENGQELIGRFMGVPEEDNGYFNEEESDMYPGCSIGEWENIIGREVTIREELALELAVPYTPKPTVGGFERAMGVGLGRLEAAEKVSESVGVDIYSYREDVDDDVVHPDLVNPDFKRDVE